MPSVLEEASMNITLAIGPIVSLIAGILILITPRLLNYIVAIYLIVIGLLGLFGAHNYRWQGADGMRAAPVNWTVVEPAIRRA
jgi:hypothetical protein